MKKLLGSVLFAGMLTAAVAAEPLAVGVWSDVPSGIGSTDVSGVALGIPVVSCGDLEGASLALCGNNTKTTSGFEFALFGFNRARSLEGVQMSLINLQEGQHGDFSLQLGLYNQAAKNGVQLGFINNGRDNATFQFGLININKNGLLPVMIFVNFGRDLFN